jgi:hypothetical protein
LCYVYQRYALILTKNGLGYILGDFFQKLIWSPCLYVVSSYVRNLLPDFWFLGNTYCWVPMLTKYKSTRPYTFQFLIFLHYFINHNSWKEVFQNAYFFRVLRLSTDCWKSDDKCFPSWVECAFGKSNTNTTGLCMHCRDKLWCFLPGLPDFSRYKIPKREKIYQISNNYTKCPLNITKGCKIDHVSIKYTNTSSIARPSKIYPNLDFWFENKPSGNPALYCLEWH